MKQEECSAPAPCDCNHCYYDRLEQQMMEDMKMDNSIYICHDHQVPHEECGCPMPQEGHDRRHRELHIISLEDEAYDTVLEEMYENGEAPI